jgi:hypothetical protein
MKLSKSLHSALQIAADRPTGTVCPVICRGHRIYGEAEQAVLEALNRRGLIEGLEHGIPRISPAGRKLIRGEDD